MLTIGQALNLFEDEMFVGRERELAIFREWLTAAAGLPVILNVSGHGGVGKSALLRAFARIAEQCGKQVALVDSRDFRHTPDGLISALASGSEGDHLSYLSERRPLIMIDTFEELGDLSRFLQEDLLPRLSTDIKVVIAGRYPLGRMWTEGTPWRSIVHTISLDAFSVNESHEYLRLRGLKESQVIERVVGAAGGNPLALSLAADMALQLGSRDFAAAPEWHLVVRSLVDRLLRDVKNPQLRELLDVCAVVRQFDEATLAAVSGQEDIGSAFDQLCRLSAVRPTEHGLMLHDDLRRALADDLRWRSPERFRGLRQRALAYYRERMRSAPPEERQWLLMERFSLWENGFIQAVLFDIEEMGQVWVEPGRVEDIPEFQRIWLESVPIYASEVGLGAEPAELAEFAKRDTAFFDTAFRYPEIRLRVARDRNGRLVGFTSSLPICQETLPIFDLHPGLTPLIHAYWTPDQLAALPDTPDDTNIFYLLYVAMSGEQFNAVRAALLRDLFGLLAHGGVYLATLGGLTYKALNEAIGFELVPGARSWPIGDMEPFDGYVLDLTRIGVERWIEAVINGRRLPETLATSELERELRGVLQHWKDDVWLAKSPLIQFLPPSADTAEARRPEALRQLILQLLSQERTQASPDQKEAYHALEVGFTQKAASQERAARSLSVSRATYYRLIRRGIRGLAEALTRTS